MRAGIWQAGLFDDRQGVDIRAQRDAGFIGVANPRDRRRRRIGNTGDIFDPDPIQLRPNRCGGFHFLKTKLGNLMQPMPQLGHAGMKRCDGGL